jgi:hypothetical protein
MRTAFVIFHHMTAMDFIGAYNPLTRLKSTKNWGQSALLRVRLTSLGHP